MTAKMVEMLVFLQRSVSKADVLSLEKADFVSARRVMESKRRDKVKQQAYREAVELAGKSKVEALELA